VRTILAAFLTIALTASSAFAGGRPQHHQVYKYGWGWDARGGFYYVGPIRKGNQRAYFRCLVPGYGWRRC
jgi:hypothetical protein